ncbi:hypothetical protein [Mumia zhuanghuii]|uniref:Uncharacterized protein n=1 Tax=Mumia zhuanghuii TaxID=2585211 RepID=A0A5C4MG69_9ACTN|nr:hypothetical protein [Mumia zhuanghuii]TNC36446.1 hypothetical protein FHE65_26205 [Mumia zhuanghuii]
MLACSVVCRALERGLDALPRERREVVPSVAGVEPPALGMPRTCRDLQARRQQRAKVRAHVHACLGLRQQQRVHDAPGVDALARLPTPGRAARPAAALGSALADAQLEPVVPTLGQRLVQLQRRLQEPPRLQLRVPLATRLDA